MSKEIDLDEWVSSLGLRKQVVDEITYEDAKILYAIYAKGKAEWLENLHCPYCGWEQINGANVRNNPVICQNNNCEKKFNFMINYDPTYRAEKIKGTK